MSRQESLWQRARSTLKNTLVRYQQRLRLPNPVSPASQPTQTLQLQATLQTEIDFLAATLDKIDRRLFQIAVLGLVSRGKSAVLNALLQQPRFQTGPLNGVTQTLQSAPWGAASSASLQVELVDTPGLDEVAGEAKSSLARTIALQADLVLFVVSGDITRTEYQALAEVRLARKPVVLVFNKVDLYPDCDRQAVYQKLQSFAASDGPASPASFITVEDIVMVAAEPAPVLVRSEWPDGRVTYSREAPPPQIETLRQKLLNLLHSEGQAMLALNSLRQVRTADWTIARSTIQIYDSQAEELIWRFARYKALIVACNPVLLLDLLVGTLADLLLIRALARLYGLPMTSHEAGRLLRTILLSTGGLVLSELGSSLFLGLSKSSAALGLDGSPGITAYLGAATAQASLAAYGTYRVGKSAKIYLQQGCTWGAEGANTAIQALLDQLEPDSFLYRLKDELSENTR